MKTIIICPHCNNTQEYMGEKIHIHCVTCNTTSYDDDVMAHTIRCLTSDLNRAVGLTKKLRFTLILLNSYLNVLNAIKSSEIKSDISHIICKSGELIKSLENKVEHTIFNPLN